MAIERICFLANYNLYESKRRFTKEFAKAFKACNVETLIVDVEERGLNRDHLRKIIKFKPTLTCSFNSMQPASPGVFLWDQIGIPHWSILVDPAIYSINLTTSPLSILSCVDRDDCKALLDHKFRRLFFMPHAIAPPQPLLPRQPRCYPIVMLATCYDYESLQSHWRSTLPPGEMQVLEAAIDHVLSQEAIPLAHALMRAWEESPISQQEIDLELLFYYLDYYTRGYDRVALVRAFKNYPVHIFGSTSHDHPSYKRGWHHYLQDCPHATIHPPVSYDAVPDLLQRSKIALNSMLFFRDGSHERALDSLACGCLPLCSYSLWLKEQFSCGQELLLYPPQGYEAAVEQVADLLNNEQKRALLAESGKEKVLKHHTWLARAKDVIEGLPQLL